jgi:serine/threonine protein kinase/tetratricopeptide (TPR) repeat protein
MEPDDDKTQTHIALTKGTMVSHYRIIEKIGAGGMGEVYLAQDTELDRKVALKFLPPHLCQDEDCRKRFKREAQAAAKLSHPNIIHVYEVSEYQGRPYFAMEHVEGRSLRDVKAEELDLDRIVGIAIQLCDGLHSAHTAGVIHRDIKPSNIIIDSSGRPRLLDFGLATVKGGEHLTKTGSTLGTVGYMSPEQIEGKETDARSDLFSLGVVLYELIANKSPFRRDDETATLKAILQDAPEPLARYKSGVPDDLQRIVSKLLEKDPGLRYQSAAGVIPDLKKLSPSRTSQVVVEKRRDSWNRYVVAAALVVLLVVAAFWYFGDRGNDPAGSDDEIRLVVLPFEHVGNADDEFFSDGLTDEIRVDLSRMSGLKVVARTSSQRYKDTLLEVEQIGQALTAKYVLTGAVTRLALSPDSTRLRITAELIDASDGTQVWSDIVDGDLSSLFDIKSGIVVSTARALGLNRYQAEQRGIESTPTSNMEAYSYYLKAVNYRREREFDLAEETVAKAIELDSSFARAIAELSYLNSIQYFFPLWNAKSEGREKELARTYADDVARLAPGSFYASWALGCYYYYVEATYDKAANEFKNGLLVDPNNSELLHVLGKLYFRQSQYELGYETLRKSFELDPANPEVGYDLGHICLFLRRGEEALQVLDRALSYNPDNCDLNQMKGLIATYYFGSVGMVKEINETAIANGADIDNPYCGRVGYGYRYDYISRDYAGWLRDMKSYGLRDAQTIMDTVSVYYWTLAWIYNYIGDTTNTRLYADSFLVKVEERASDYITMRGVVELWDVKEKADMQAVAGYHDKALANIEEVLRHRPQKLDGRNGVWTYFQCAAVLTILGEEDRAIAILEDLLGRPSPVNASVLRLLPDFDPLRDHPRFQALIEKYEEKHGTLESHEGSLKRFRLGHIMGIDSVSSC